MEARTANSPKTVIRWRKGSLPTATPAVAIAKTMKPIVHNATISGLLQKRNSVISDKGNNKYQSTMLAASVNVSTLLSSKHLNGLGE
jgi:hypothetical protein